MAANNTPLVPGTNPTGAPGYGSSGFVPGAGTSSGQNPLLLPPNLPASAPQANPYDTTTIPTFGANAGTGYSPTSLLPPGSSSPSSNPISGLPGLTSGQQGRTLGELQTLYGEGLGALMYQFLQSGAGFNQGAINNLFAALGPGIERGTESLVNQFSTSGNRFGSGAQIGTADYLSQVQLNEGQLETQMYESAISNYLNTLTGVTSQNLQLKEFNEAQPGAFDDIVSLIGAINPFGSHTGGPPQQPPVNVPPIAPAGSNTSIPELPSDYTPIEAIGTPQNLSLFDTTASLTGGGSYDSAGIPMI